MRINGMILLCAAAVSGAAGARTPSETNRPFDQYSWVTTHNAFTSNGAFKNQSETIREQLDHGVRGLMLDLHANGDRVSLCHNRCVGDDTEHFADFINDTLLPFLATDPDAIVTLQLEDFTSERELMTELARARGLAGKTFDPSSWQGAAWPTYQAMVDAGQRVLIFSLRTDHTGRYPVGAGGIHILSSELWTVENYWSMGTFPIQSHDHRCRSRWSDQLLSRGTIDGKPGWRPLFTMNHFHDVGVAFHASSDNAFDALESRYLSRCLPAAGRKPNFIAVDFHQEGETAAFAEWLTLSAPDRP